jgi:hypothetical protein
MVALNGSGSTDSDSTPGTNDDIVSFVWSEGSAAIASGEVTSAWFARGEHTVVLTVTDRGGANDDDQVVIRVHDSIPPAITCPPSATAACRTGGSVSVSLAPATASDSCSGTATIVNDRTPNGPDASGAYPPGITIVTFTATDAAGNSASCTTTVTVPTGTCDDGNPCTDDACVPASGCVHTTNTAPCNDHNTCTTADACSLGTCVGGQPLNCDDQNPGTADSCDPASGCIHAANDGDGDGVRDAVDRCPSSILTSTVVVGTCDSGVPNTLLASGCTVFDMVAPCLSGGPWGRVNRCIMSTLNTLVRQHVITPRQKQAIDACARSSHSAR